MIEIEQSDTFRKWETRLKDRRARVIIAARIARLAEGLPGDVEPVGEGVSELRIHYGPGYRVYFQQRGNVLILLLCGGDKKTQRRDIETAKKIAKDWSAQND
jgi:putative addiction module killer protein